MKLAITKEDIKTETQNLRMQFCYMIQINEDLHSPIILSKKKKKIAILSYFFLTTKPHPLFQRNIFTTPFLNVYNLIAKFHTPTFLSSTFSHPSFYKILGFIQTFNRFLKFILIATYS